MEEEEYIVQGDSQGSSNRPFYTAVGVLLVIFILAGGCAAVSLLNRNGGTNQIAQATVSAIETQNAIVAVTNEAVTQTIAAMETQAALPTSTATPPPTFTPSPAPTETPRPTNTPVVTDGNGEGQEMATPNLSGTSTFDDATDGSTPTPIPVPGGTGGDNGSLPDTGIDTWSAMVIGLALVAVLLMARRLRRA